MARTRRAPIAAVVAGLALVASLVSGCASHGLNQPGASADSAPSSPNPKLAAADPLRLVGSWQLDAPGQAEGSVLRLGDDLSLWSSCGYLTGSWGADPAGLFAGHIAGGSGKCMPSDPSDPTPDWLTRVTAFKVDAAGAELLDSSGSVVARLKPGGHPTPGPDIASKLAEPPVVTDDLRAHLRPAPPLPPGLVPATPARLAGRWGSADNPQLRGFVQMAADGSWSGSDGANAQGGRWSADSAGNLVTVAGIQTLAGCMPDSCVDVSNWLVSASRAGFDGSVLVLIDADGKVTGRLAHADAPPPQVVPPGSGSAVPSSPATSGSPAAAASSVSLRPAP